MKYLLNFLILWNLINIPLLQAQANEDTHSLRAFRYISSIIRDEQPSVAEAKAYYNREKTLPAFMDEWKNTSQFEQRLKRSFNDWFGVGVELELLEFSHYLTESDEGVLQIPVKGTCSLAEAVDATAWWLEGEGKVKVCPNLVGTETYFLEDDIHCAGGGAQGILNSKCTCGPKLILCMPLNLRHIQAEKVKEEFSERALYSYQNELSWLDLLGGNFLVGGKYLYHFYLMSGSVMVSERAPSQTEYDTLASLAIDDLSRLSFPENNPERAGVVTSPGFMQQNNNFRSRIRALTESLLCKDIDGSLNTTNISEFYNEDLSEFDKSHGTKAECSGCHYPMDNMGSTILGWNSAGFHETWRNLAQNGWAFGQQGTGPLFLMQAFVERADGFHDCVSQKLWEDFTGSPWADVPKSTKDQLIAQAQNGPRALVNAILTPELLLPLRSEASQSQNTGSTGNLLSFETDIQPILERSCAGSACHSTDSSLGTRYQFLGNPNRFKQVPVSRIDDGSMPPANSGLSIEQTEIDLLKRYIEQ